MKKVFFLLIWIVVSGSGCIKQEQPEAEVSLTDFIAFTRTSLTCASYDMRSALIKPFLTHFGQFPEHSNIVTPEREVQWILLSRFTPPHRIVVEASETVSNLNGSTIYVELNDISLGFIVLKGASRRKSFDIKKEYWNPPVNVFRFYTRGKKGNVPVEIRNIWIDSSEDTPLEELKKGNRFCQVVLIPDWDGWKEVVFLPAHASVSFPVLLPEPKTYFQGWVKPSDRCTSRLECRIITARPFHREKPLTTYFNIKESNIDWMEMTWDISGRRGRYAIVELRNDGDKDVYLKDLAVRNWKSGDSGSGRWI